VSLRAKIEIFFHLGGGMLFPLSVVVFLLTPPLLYFEVLGIQYIYVYLAPTALATLTYLVTGESTMVSPTRTREVTLLSYCSAFEIPRVQFHANVLGCLNNFFSNLVPMFALFEMFIGLTMFLSLAHFEGWFSKDATFHATPKDGSVAKELQPALVPKKDAEVPKDSDSDLTVLEANQPAAPSTDSAPGSVAPPARKVSAMR
jgi:hypothetical protein